MPYAVPSSTGGTATTPIAPLTAASTHSWPPRPMLSWTLPGGEDHGNRVAYPQQVAPQALLARLHHRAVLAGAEDLCLELMRAEVVRQRPGELLGRDGGAVDPLEVQRRHPAGPRAFALLRGHFVPSLSLRPGQAARGRWHPRGPVSNASRASGRRSSPDQGFLSCQHL